MTRIGTVVAGLVLLTVGAPAGANHGVIVEGTCLGPGGTQRVIVPPGTCGDYDGDGLLGTMEDADEADRVFGTISAALGNTDLGATINATRANQNGRVLVVASGTFPEVVSITAAGGNVTLEAAAGADVNVDAVLQGDANNAARQGAPGIVVDAPADRFVTIRNIVSRNWTVGFKVVGDSRVALDRIRSENNRDFGVMVTNRSRVTISRSQVSATGFRQGTGVDNTPSPGIGVEFLNRSTGSIHDSTIAGSFSAGLSIDIPDGLTGRAERRRAASATVERSHLQLSDNARAVRKH